MTKYIDKSALVAEIKRRIKEIDEIGTYLSPKGTLTNLLCFLDTLEVKEVDIDTDFGVCWGEYCDCGGNINDYKIAKHFFELGLKAQKS